MNKVVCCGAVVFLGIIIFLFFKLSPVPEETIRELNNLEGTRSYED